MADSQGMHSAGSILYVASYAQAAPAARPVGTDWVAGESFGLGSWKSFPELIDANGIDIRPTVTRVTHLRSPDKSQEKVPGFKDGNQLSARFNYSKAFMLALVALVPGASGALDQPLGLNNVHSFWGKKKWFILLPDGGGWYFTGFLAGMPTQVPEDDRITIDATIEVSGAPTWVSLA